MKIEGNSATVNLQSMDKGTKKASTASLQGVDEGAQDRATLRTGTLSLQSLTAQAMSSPEVRQDKVNALSQSVQRGDYKVDSSMTAEAIIASEDL